MTAVLVGKNSSLAVGVAVTGTVKRKSVIHRPI